MSEKSHPWSLINMSAWIRPRQGWYQETWEQFLGALNLDRNNFILLILFGNGVYFITKFQKSSWTFPPHTLNWSLSSFPVSFHSPYPQLCCGTHLPSFFKAQTLLLKKFSFFFFFLTLFTSSILSPKLLFLIVKSRIASEMGIFNIHRTTISPADGDFLL